MFFLSTLFLLVLMFFSPWLCRGDHFAAAEKKEASQSGSDSVPIGEDNVLPVQDNLEKSLKAYQKNIEENNKSLVEYKRLLEDARAVFTEHRKSLEKKDSDDKQMRAELILNQRVLMAAALTGSLTLMSIMTASISILYGTYQRCCIPTVENGRPKTLEPVCQIIVDTAYLTIGSLLISAASAFFAVLSLIGNYWWSVLLVKGLILFELILVPFIGIRVVCRLMPLPAPSKDVISYVSLTAR